MSRPGEKAGQQSTEAVLAEIVRQTPFLRRALRKRGVPESDIDDLAQRCVLAAWKALKKRPFRVPKGKTLADAVRAWLATIATMQSLNHRRKVELRDRRFVHDDLAIENAVAGANVEEQVGSAEVLQALDRLGPRRRRLLMLAGLGWTAEEIALEMGGDPDTVAAQIQRARKAFREALVRWRR